MVEAVLAAFLRSASVLVLPLMVTYLGSKSRSTSTPSSRVGRSRRCPTVAFTSYPDPRYFPMVLALVGDSTMTRAGRPSRPRVGAPFFLARLTFWARVDASGAVGLAAVPLRSGALRPVFAVLPVFPVPSRRSGRALLSFIAIVP